jgi:Leucine-rich repeat (LRR) protein
MVEVEEKVGNPWSILPIKNSKYARDLVEVHLSDRQLTRLEHFEEFPNLEVIWLNNNNVSGLTDCAVTEPQRHQDKLQS